MAIFEELRPKTEATRQQADKGPRHQTAVMSEKQENIQLDLQKDHRQSEDHKAKSRILRRVVENQGLDLVEGSTPSKMENKTAHRGGAHNVDCYSSCVKICCQETDSGDCNRLRTLVPVTMNCEVWK
jgi:hypothetical protein